LAIAAKSHAGEWLDLSRILRQAEKEEIIITRHGKPAGDWFEYRLQNDARFLSRVEAAPCSLKAGQGISIEDLDK
jgi:hypothetical protein